MRTSRTTWRLLAAAGAAAGLGSLLLLPPATAQPPARPGGTVQPDRLPFGTVHAHSIVQGSARFSFQGQNGRRLQVDAPDFVTVKDVRPGKDVEERGGAELCDIFFELNTDRPGEHSGTLEVQLGDQRATLSVTASVLPNRPGLTRVLVTTTPFDLYATNDAKAYQPLLDLAKSGKLDMNYFEPVRGQSVLPETEKLSAYFDVILLADTGLVFVRDEDVARLRRFVDDGGRLVVAANYFMRGTVAKANEIVKPYDLHVADTEPLDRAPLIGPGGRADLASRLIKAEAFQLAEDPLVEGVQKLHFFRPSPVRPTDREKAKVLVASPYYPDEGLVDVWRGKGEVVVLGESLWWNWIGGEQAKDSDNARLLQNLLTREKKK